MVFVFALCSKGSRADWAKEKEKEKEKEESDARVRKRLNWMTKHR
jgi:hypothetical protein